jgi:ankyrin repeat protein
MSEILINGPQKLRWAAVSGDLALVQDLLAAGVQVDSLDNAALRSAVRHNRPEIVEALLTADAPLEEDCAREFLEVAAESGFPDVLTILLKSLPTPSAHEEAELIRKATKSGNVAALSVLLEALDHPCIDDPDPIITAACQGNVPLMDLLVHHGADVRARDSKALFSAAFARSPDAVAYLIEQGTPCDIEEGAALHLALCHGDAEIAEVLLEGGVPITCPEWIIECANKDSLQALHLLILHGVSLQDHADDLVIKAADSAAPRVLRFVLDQVTIDRTVLSHALGPAVRKAAAPVIRLLLDRGADPSTNGSEPLKIALASGELGLARWLLDGGAHVLDLDGTALVHSLDDAALMKRLLRSGLNLQNTPLTPLVANRLCKVLDPIDLFLEAADQQHPENICRARLLLARRIAQTAASQTGTDKVPPTIWLTNVLAASPYHP